MYLMYNNLGTGACTLCIITLEQVHVPQARYIIHYIFEQFTIIRLVLRHQGIKRSNRADSLIGTVLTLNMYTQKSSCD